jgi:N-acetylglucosaminyldiphosphoundecaprenol N-acetyl-beta-D-mannosaminyltransferase
MTAPQQERWTEKTKARLDIGFVAAIGAVFDFYAGTKARAPLLVAAALP